MSVDDVKDLMAILRTLPPVAGRPPDAAPPFPFNIRRSIGVWKLLHLDRGPIRPDLAHEELWNRGRYLAEAAGHCAGCHGARGILGGIKTSSRLAGGQDVEGLGFASRQ